MVARSWRVLLVTIGTQVHGMNSIQPQVYQLDFNVNFVHRMIMIPER